MKFCTACGSALEFFEFLDDELCSTCLKKDNKCSSAAPARAEEAKVSIDELSDSILCFEDNKLVLKSEEGWVLWSAPCNEQNKIKTVLSRAQRILEIRRKRRKSK